MQQLVIRLASHADLPIHWMLYSTTEGEIIASGELSSDSQLSSLQEHATESTVIALAPASDVLLTTVTIPKNANRKVLSAIPYMLEENICADVSEQHVALGKREGERQQVAVIEKQKLIDWQETLKDAGIFCQRLIPDAILLPTPSENHVSLLQLGNSLLVKTSEYEALQGEVDWLLPLILANDEIQIYAFSEIENADLPDNSEFNFDELPLERLRQQISSADINLFQGDFAVKAASNPFWQKWRIAAVLAIFALSANLVGKTIELNHLKSEKAKVDQSISQTVKASFPGIQRVRMSIIKRLVEQEMQRLEGAGGGASMLALLSKMSGAFSNSGVTPQTLRFDSSRTELRMQSVANNFESLERFRRDIQSLGLQVDQGAINNRGDQVVGVIVVKG